MKPETLLKLVAWERSYLRDHDNTSMIKVFQELIDSGDIKDMEPFYQRTAHTLIEYGLCYVPQLRIVK